MCYSSIVKQHIQTMQKIHKMSSRLQQNLDYPSWLRNVSPFITGTQDNPKKWNKTRKYISLLTDIHYLNFFKFTKTKGFHVMFNTVHKTYF